MPRDAAAKDAESTDGAGDPGGADAARTARGPGREDALRRGPDTRKAIDRAAVELFFQKGYHATSMRDIGNACGVQPAAIYHWYPNKEALLNHLQDDFMRKLTRRVQAAVERHDRAALRLAAAVHEHVLFHTAYPREAFVTDSEIRALSPQPRRDLIAKRDTYQRYFYDIVQAGIGEGDFSPAESHVATYAILLQCTGVALWFKPTGGMTADEVARYHVDLVLGALHTPAEVVSAAIAAVAEVS